jgi:hypothetical protein
MANKPEYTHRLNQLEVAVWKNESDTAIWHNITFQRVYRDNEGAIQNTNNFRMTDLPTVAFLSAKAYDFLASKEVEIIRQEPVNRFRAGIHIVNFPGSAICCRVVCHDAVVSFHGLHLTTYAGLPFRFAYSPRLTNISKLCITA